MKFKEEYIEKEVEPLFKREINLQKNKELKPIMKLNKAYLSSQKVINKHSWSYAKMRIEVNESIQARMSMHGIVFEIYDLVDSSDHFLFLLEQQQLILKNVIKEMISIVTEETSIEENEEDSKKETSEDWKLEREGNERPEE